MLDISMYCKSTKKLLTGLAASLFLLDSALAQLPLLELPSSLTGEATSASFYAGVSADNGATFGSVFGYSAPLDITAEVEVETTHVGTQGNLYILIVLGEDVFMRSGPEIYEIWDGTFENLNAAVASTSLLAREQLIITDDVPFGPAGVFDVSMELYLAYDTVANPGELYFNGIPLVFSIQAEDAVLASQLIYEESVSAEIVQTKCIVCHTSTGIASTSGLILKPSSEADFLTSNYNSLINYIQNTANGSERILAKPQGLDSHGGGVQLAGGSADFLLWEDFVEAALADIESMSGGVTSSASLIFENVIPLNNKELYRKASLLFAGMIPNAEELNQISTLNESELKLAIRDLLEGPNFTEFLIEGANNRLLTQAFNGNMFNIVDRKYYPNSTIYFQNLALRQRGVLIAESLAEGPLRLIDHVVQLELPYTEILTADYTLMNPYSAEIYNSSLEFDDPENYEDWKVAQITDYFRCSVCNRNDEDNIYDIATDYPHAGVLNSPAFLSRYPSTETNRNRARARWAYYYFLGVDIEAISQRTTDQEALLDLDNPTLNNPNCVVCHDIMDPVAGTFQNYSDDGFYRGSVGGLDSLPFSYKRDRESNYQTGDTWYADMLLPGFGSSLAPNPDNSIQWLANEFAADSRFGFGTVNFWYVSIMGRDPYDEPENPEDADYESRLAAYLTEQDMIAQVAADFTAGAAGNGAYNLKDLLVDLVMSEQFSSGSVTEVLSKQEIELEDVGAGNLLTPEQLNRKLTDITGFEWSYGRSSALEEVYNLVYGGIDSLGITERATELTTLMSAVVTAMANESSCSIVNNDFSLPQSERKLFPHVELSSLPASAENDIRLNIQYLHQQFLGEELTSNDTEINATFELFEAIRNARVAANKGNSVTSPSELCIFENVENPIFEDANQTLRSWAAVVNYLMRDYRFIHE